MPAGTFHKNFNKLLTGSTRKFGFPERTTSRFLESMIKKQTKIISNTAFSIEVIIEKLEDVTHRFVKNKRNIISRP